MGNSKFITKSISCALVALWALSLSLPAWAANLCDATTGSQCQKVQNTGAAEEITGKSSRATYIASVAGQATTAAITLSIESAASTGFRLLGWCVSGVSNATAAAAVTVTVQRRTTASSAGTALTAEGTGTTVISKMDPADGNYGGIARLGGTPGTAGAVLDQAGFQVGEIGAGAAAVTGTSTTFDANLATSPIADIIIVGAGAAGADLITTVAARSSNTALTTTANAGTTVSGAAYATEPVAGDTLASHINSWTEITPYSNANRPTWTKNGAASGGAMSNSSSKASFTINATSRIFGAFMATDNTKGGTTGILYGGGLFTSGGSRAVQSGDSVNVQVDLSVTAS